MANIFSLIKIAKNLSVLANVSIILLKFDPKLYKIRTFWEYSKDLHAFIISEWLDY